MQRARIRGGRWYEPFAVVAASIAFACGQPTADLPPTIGGYLAVGTWGADGAGLIVQDTVAHLHIGCTFGDMPAPIAVDQNGAFDIAGSYVLRAYPVMIGPSLPARFAGHLAGSKLTITVTIDDTVQHQTVVKGPVTVTVGEAPKLGPCPICVR
jgi:hypothetical protein